MTYICSPDMTDANWDMCAITKPHFISSSVTVLYSLRQMQVLTKVVKCHNTPVFEASTDCLTAGLPGPVYPSLWPVLCTLHLAVLAFYSNQCHLCIQAAGVPANLLPLTSAFSPWPPKNNNFFFLYQVIFCNYLSFSSFPLLSNMLHPNHLI